MYYITLIRLNKSQSYSIFHPVVCSLILLHHVIDVHFL